MIKKRFLKRLLLNCEQHENMQMMQSSHFRPSIDSEVSALVYDFNQREEAEAGA
jgi:hypothetical protein